MDNTYEKDMLDGHKFEDFVKEKNKFCYDCVVKLNISVKGTC